MSHPTNVTAFIEDLDEGVLAERLPAVIRWSIQTHRELDEKLLDMRVSMLTSKGVDRRPIISRPTN